MIRVINHDERPSDIGPGDILEVRRNGELLHWLVPLPKEPSVPFNTYEMIDPLARPGVRPEDVVPEGMVLSSKTASRRRSAQKR